MNESATNGAPKADSIEWMSVYQFVHRDIQYAMRLGSFMGRLGLRGSLFRIELLLEMQDLYERHIERIKAQ